MPETFRREREHHNYLREKFGKMMAVEEKIDRLLEELNEAEQDGGDRTRWREVVDKIDAAYDARDGAFDEYVQTKLEADRVADEEQEKNEAACKEHMEQKEAADRIAAEEERKR